MYKFRREDNGKVVEVDFATMMEKDAAGYIELEDGVMARQVPAGGNFKRSTSDTAEDRKKWDAWANPLASDAMGFPEQQIEQFRADAEANGFTGIEFVHEPDNHFYHVESSCPSQWNKYRQHRGFTDRNGSLSSKVMLSEREMEQARELVSRQSEERDNDDRDRDTTREEAAAT